MLEFINYWSISSVILVEEAKKLGLEVDVISKNKNTFYIKGNGKEILFKSTDFGENSALGFKLALDKELSYKILEKNNLPIAKSYYLSKESFKDFDFFSLKNFNFPLIIKPVDEAHGNGVMMNILSNEELKEKLIISFKKYDNMIIQEEIKGDEIRVLVVKGKVILARNRIPAGVLGDGENTIEKLIEIENKTNSFRGKGYEKPLSFIEIDDELLSFISKQGLNLNSVPKKGEKVQLRGNSNIGTGGTMMDVTKQISDDIKDICIKSCDLFGLKIAGVDILTSDFTKPLKDTGGIILELNATPSLGGERELTNVNTGKEILKILFLS